MRLYAVVYWIQRPVKRFIRWRENTLLGNKIVMSLSFAMLTGLMAQVRIYLPWTPVPITLQTFSVLLSPLILGLTWGTIAQVLYVLLGIFGMPWFAGWKGGITYLFSPTTGYLMGFILSAAFVGWCLEKTKIMKNTVGAIIVLMLANFVLIYLPGLLVLYLWLRLNVKTVTILQLLNMGLFPFVIGDLVKLFCLLPFSSLFRPSKDYSYSCQPLR